MELGHSNDLERLRGKDGAWAAEGRKRHHGSGTLNVDLHTN